MLVVLGKMKLNTSNYACRVTLQMNKDGNHRYYGDYKTLNMETQHDSFPMLLVEDVLTQLGKSQSFLH